MMEYVIYIVLTIGAVAIALGIMMFAVGSSQAISKAKKNYFYVLPYLIIFSSGFEIAISGRVLDGLLSTLSEDTNRPALAIWTIRLISLSILALSSERIIRFIEKNRHLYGALPNLTLGYVFFWIGSVGCPMFLSANPYFSHDYIYPLIIGLALLTLSKDETEKFLIHSRNALVSLIVASILYIPINPKSVFEFSYSQGFISGLPRFAGLTPHAVVYGYIAQLTMILLWFFPIKAKKSNQIIWLICLITIFIAQSKTSWTSSILCFAFIYIYNNKEGFLKQLLNPDAPWLAKSLLSVIIITGTLFFTNLIWGGFGENLERFLGSSEGQQLTSLTGRDQIWAVALTEWQAHPIFGYGPRMFDTAHRLIIGLPSAIHGHNQFIDLLGRTGVIGFISSIIYISIIFKLTKKSTSNSHGMAFALFLVIFIRCISEVPLTLYGYGPEFFAQLILLATLIRFQPEKEKSEKLKCLPL